MKYAFQWRNNFSPLLYIQRIQMMNTASQLSLLFSISASEIKNLQILNSKLRYFMNVVPLSQMTAKWPDINMIYLLSILKRASKWGIFSLSTTYLIEIQFFLYKSNGCRIENEQAFMEHMRNEYADVSKQNFNITLEFGPETE